jgi:error-prone DNA polymerase
MKVDVLALGMLSAIRKAMDALGIADMADIPEDDPAVYAMLSRADSVGVFQVESRAQMSMLPRMKPTEFYDLVIEVAIVRPGPIQGDMVHPYLRRREGRESVAYPSPAPEHGPADELQAVLGKTLGVPLFQEQAMRLAIEAAKFTPEEANGLRRAMATFKHAGDVGVYGEKFIGGMVARGYDAGFAQRCFRQIEGFGSYGFPESHAVSFAKLVWVSAWIKHHHPEVFCAALLNSQPMGFYQPAQLVRDAREHGVEVRPVDVMASHWDSTLESAGSAPSVTTLRAAPPPPRCAQGRSSSPVKRGRWQAAEGGLTEGAVGRPRQAVRLGLRQVKGLRREEAERLVAARRPSMRHVAELAQAADLSARTLELLAEADALRSLAMDRREGLWAVKGLAPEAGAKDDAPLLALMGPPPEPPPALPPMTLGAHVAEDYRTVSLSLKAHPCIFFRPLLDELGAVTARSLRTARDGARLCVGGVVLIRQRPGTAKGVVFVTLEDETGSANAVVWKDVFTANRRAVMGSRFLVVHGRLQKAGEVIHLVAERFTDLTGRLGELKAEPAVDEVRRSPAPPLGRSRDFH